MRFLMTIFTGLLAFSVSSIAEARALPRVHVEMETEIGSWRPLSRRDVARTVETAVLEELSRPGLVHWQRPKKRAKSLPAHDYRLLVQARLLDEAETHTVFLSFGPGMKNDVPSLHASDTVVLSKKKRGQILTLITSSARKAARELLRGLKPALKFAGSGANATPHHLDEKLGKMAFEWAPVRVPKRNMGKAAKDLYSRARKIRQGALRELTSYALEKSTPRNVLERCVLEHFDSETKFGCLVALRPLSRRIPQTQRVVMQALRTAVKRQLKGLGYHEHVREIIRESNSQMEFFTNVGRREAIQTWIWTTAQGHSTGKLDGLGDVPHLDFAIQSCLRKAGAAREKRRVGKGAKAGTCLKLVDALPNKRRWALLWPFVKELNDGSPKFLDKGQFKDSVELLLQRSRKMDPKLEKVLWKRYQRYLDSSGELFADFGRPSKWFVERMLEMVQTAGSRDALDGIKRSAREDKRLSAMARDKLSELIAIGNYPKKVSKRDLERTIKDLEKIEAKR